MPVEEVAKEAAEKAGSVIPVLYYDIIARIIPGSAFIAGALYPSPSLSKPDVPTLIIWLGAGYLVGLLLTGLSLALDVVWLLVSLLFDVKFSPFNVPKNIDKVLRVDPSVANILFKMLAEATACGNLITGYVVLWVLSQISSAYPTILKTGVQSTAAKWWIFGILLLCWAYRAIAVSVRTGNWEPPSTP